MNHAHASGPSVSCMDASAQLVTFVPMKFVKRAGRKEVIRIDAAPQDQMAQAKPVTTMLTALAKAFHWQRLIDMGMCKSGTEIAKREGLDLTVVNELLRLTRLDPDIVEAILAGTVPARFTLNWFARNPMPIEWPAQRKWIELIEAGAVQNEQLV